MKFTILILSIFLSLTSCSDDEAKSQENSLLGTWKLIETYGSDGGSSPQWTTVNNGYSYSFNANNSLISNRFTCNGNYQENSNSNVHIQFNCTDSQFDLSYNYVIENGYLILTPSSANCDEGCGEKYQKVIEE